MNNFAFLFGKLIFGPGRGGGEGGGGAHNAKHCGELHSWSLQDPQGPDGPVRSHNVCC